MSCNDGVCKLSVCVCVCVTLMQACQQLRFPVLHPQLADEFL